MPDKELTYDNTLTAFKQSKDDYDIEIGDVKSAKHEEQVKIKVNKEWSNMFNISSRLVTEGLFDKQASEKEISELNGIITSNSDLIKNEYFDIKDKDGNIEGKEHEITLFEPPKKGELDFSFQFRGCDMILQPPLTKEFESGFNKEFNREIEVTETQVIDTKSKLVLVERPIEIVNSFAIYNNQGLSNNRIYPDKRNANYFTGKFAHRKRDFLTLPDGKIIWLNPVFDAKTGIMKIALPMDSLKDESLWKAGVKVDPTFGYTTEGGSSALSSALHINGVHNLSEAGTITQMSAYGATNGDTNNLSLSIWTISGSTATLIYEDDGSVSVGSGGKWNSVTFNDALSSGDYYLGMWCSDTGYYYAYDANAGYKRYFTSGSTFRTYPSTFSIGSATNRIVSNYATYTAGGGGATFKPYARWLT